MENLQEIHRIQRSFRAVMDAMARPGKPFDMVHTQNVSTMTGVLDTSVETLVTMFIDQAVSFCVVAQQREQVQTAIAAQTHARIVSLEEAEFVVIAHDMSDAVAEEAVLKASGGTLLSPEKGTTIFVSCSRIVGSMQDAAEHKEDNPLYWVSVEGPGVKDAHTFGVDRCDWLWARGRREDEFPCGIDIVLVDAEGCVVALPRTAFVSLLATEGEVA